MIDYWIVVVFDGVYELLSQRYAILFIFHQPMNLIPQDVSEYFAVASEKSV
jgi:hypothetical protein